MTSFHAFQQAQTDVFRLLTSKLVLTRPGVKIKIKQLLNSVKKKNKKKTWHQ